MFKVVLWDYTGESAGWVKTFLKDDVEIIRTLRPDDPDQADVIMRGDWNFVLIFEEGRRELFNEIFKIMREMNFSTENIVFAKDASNWAEKPTAVYALLKPQTCEQIYRHINFSKQKQWNDYVTCTVEGVSYVAPSTDLFRMHHMFVNRVNWASHDMKIFQTLAKKFYGVDDSAGYFLDLGANIGTTGIYFCKKLAPNLKLLAFEPDAENFKMLRTNLILNDLESVSKAVNCGLGNKSSDLMLYRNGLNSGAIGFIKHEQSTPISPVKIIPLDSYLTENKIAAEEVKYIWIDTEGFEPQVLLGAKSLLAKNSAPVFMECNLRAWDNSGYFDDMLALLSEHYTHFIRVQVDETIYPLDALKTMQRPDNDLGQLGDIFLIKTGTVN